MGLFSELKLPVPWGHIAAKAWGSPSGRPVLCLHAWLDNANSFDRLIPLLPTDFYYVVMDFGGHGLSSHYSPGVPYHLQNFISEVRRVVAALKWNCFSIMAHSFGGIVGGMFSCIFPEMVEKLTLFDAILLVLDTNEMENLLTYQRTVIEHTLQQDEASKKPSRVFSLEEILQRSGAEQRQEDHFAKLSQLATHLLLRGRSLVRRFLEQPKCCTEFISRERLVPSLKKLQAHVLFIKAREGIYDVTRGNHHKKEPLGFTIEMLKSVLKERFQYVEVPGNHYVHMNQPDHVAGVVSSFLESKDRLPAKL